MEVQWIMLAKELRTNKDNTMCIDGIYHHLTNVPTDKDVELLLIIKLIPSLTESDETKEIAIAVEHTTEGLIWIQEIPYKVHDMMSLIDYHPYLTLRLKELRFPYSGEYTFKVFVDKKRASTESITVDTEVS